MIRVNPDEIVMILTLVQRKMSLNSVLDSSAV